ncbi:hypothetical protein KEM52_002128, partial [Ascosphaera acerosa]
VHLERPQAVRPVHRPFPGHAAPGRAGVHADRGRAGACLQRRAQEGGRPGLRQGRGHGEAVRLAGSQPGGWPGGRVDGRHGLRERGDRGEDVQGQQDRGDIRGHEQHTAHDHREAAGEGVHAV